jgi:hypothetical protein
VDDDYVRERAVPPKGGECEVIDVQRSCFANLKFPSRKEKDELRNGKSERRSDVELKGIVC